MIFVNFKGAREPVLIVFFESKVYNRTIFIYSLSFFCSKHKQGAFMDFKEIAAKLGFDEDDFKELVELFITTSLPDIDKIKKGVQQGNSQDVAAASHSIKGAAGNLGFDDMFTLAKAMETQAKNGDLDNFEAYITDLENKVNALNNI
jgi:HPt (histidine-containing phosphotransfer) domain-containing protein